MYTVSIPDIDHWRKEIKCQDACPVHTDARGYIKAIRDGDYERAYLIARGPNPLASICGRICGAPCELNCRRGSIDAPVAIRALKRFASTSYNAHDAEKLRTIIDRILRKTDAYECAGVDELSFLGSSVKKGLIPKVSNQRIAIIGSGPAGLAAAHDLALLGFSPVVFEMENIEGGMLALGVPEYRLPRDIIRKEIEVIRAMGVEFFTGVKIGEEMPFADLIRHYAAVIIAVGAKKSRALRIKGADAKGVFGGVEFLRDISLGNHFPLGRKVIVVGGGNVAFDVSRTVLRRLGSDISRTAVRQPFTEEVHLCCLESREEMPADEIEIREGVEEGVVLHNSLGPDEILVGDSGVCTGVRFKRALNVFDENGRFNPTFDENDTSVVEGDTVLLAIGQSYDFSFIDPEAEGIRFLPNGAFELDENASTTRAGVFVAGDAALGPRLMIDAIAHGKAVARNVYEYITGSELSTSEEQQHYTLPGYSREARFEQVPQQRPPSAGIAERKRSLSVEVEAAFNDEKAHLEADRCLDCGVNTIFDGSKCILCGGCADVCPELCLRLVSIDQIQGDEVFESFSDRITSPNRAVMSAIIKNDERCIRCAACADRCPVGAITMERFNFWEQCKCQ